MKKQTNVKMMLTLIRVGILSLFLLIFSFFAVEIVTVGGSQVGVKETLSGVDTTPLMPGTYFLFPGWTQRVYLYDLSPQTYILTENEKEAGRDGGAFHVQSADAQDMGISLSARWRLNPEKIIWIHQKIRSNFEEKVIRTEILRTVKDEATVQKAIYAYSGEGLVKLQQAIETDLIAKDGELAKNGIVLDNLVIEHIKLDEKYIGEIRLRQVATQRKLRADEETKASEAEALRAKADEQADYNRKVVQAERDKAVGILKAEQNAKQLTLGAEANKKQVVLAAEAEKEAGVLKAQAVTALGAAEAEATKLKLSAFAVQGSDNYTKIEVSKSLANAFGNIRGYLPSDMNVHVISENFMHSMDALLGARKAVQ